MYLFGQVGLTFDELRIHNQFSGVLICYPHAIGIIMNQLKDFGIIEQAISKWCQLIVQGVRIRDMGNTKKDPPH